MTCRIAFAICADALRRLIPLRPRSRSALAAITTGVVTSRIHAFGARCEIVVETEAELRQLCAGEEPADKPDLLTQSGAPEWSARIVREHRDAEIVLAA